MAPPVCYTTAGTSWFSKADSRGHFPTQSLTMGITMCSNWLAWLRGQDGSIGKSPEYLNPTAPPYENSVAIGLLYLQMFAVQQDFCESAVSEDAPGGVPSQERW